MSKVTFTLLSDDPLASLSGVVTPLPLAAPAKPVKDGFIALAPLVTDSIDVMPDTYMFAFNLNGQGGAITVKITEGVKVLKERTIDPAKQGYTNHWFPFVVT